MHDHVTLSAHGGMQAQRYTDARIAELQSALDHLRHDQARYERQHLSYRLTIHVAGLTIALVATLITVGVAMPMVVQLALPFLPSVALEVIDKKLSF